MSNLLLFFLGSVLTANMFDKIISKENIYDAFRKTRKGQLKFRASCIKFGSEETLNLSNLIRDLKEEVYIPSNYNKFKVHEPKERIIFSPRYVDKIVQHAICNVVAPFLYKKFIHDSYACIVGKGNRAAVYRIHYYLRLNNRQYPNTGYVLQLDISKFFYSIDRDKLIEILSRKMSCRRTARLITVIILSSPEATGLPLGNLISQLLANFYMNELDQFCKNVLCLKNYVRYADDMTIFIESREKAQETKIQIEHFLESKLGLKLNPRKTVIQRSNKKILALGFLIDNDHIFITGKNRRKLNNLIKSIPDRLKKGEPLVRVERSLNSFADHLRTGSHKGYFRLMEERYPYIVLRPNGLFKIL